MDQAGKPSGTNTRAYGKNPRTHGRRPIRSSLAGPVLTNPNGRIAVFKNWAAAVIQFLVQRFPAELSDVNIGFATVPMKSQHEWDPEHSVFYSVDRANRTIVLYRMPIQKFRGLHVNDDEHRRLFLEHIVYRAVCEYLEVQPWELLPGYFEHY